MSYAATGYGDFDPQSCVSCHFHGSDEVYLLRLHVTGAVLADPTDAILFIEAFGLGRISSGPIGINPDIRGVAVWRETDDTTIIDLVITYSSGNEPIPGTGDGTDDMVRKIMLNPGLRSRFPNLAIQTAEFGKLIGPKTSIEHWLSLPVLWDHNLNGGKGGPTAAHARPADYSIVLGRADDGAAAKPWLLAHGPLAPNTPLSPLSGNTGTLWFVGLAVATGVGLYYVFRPKRGTR